MDEKRESERDKKVKRGLENPPVIRNIILQSANVHFSIYVIRRANLGLIWNYIT